LGELKLKVFFFQFCVFKPSLAAGNLEIWGSTPTSSWSPRSYCFILADDRISDFFPAIFEVKQHGASPQNWILAKAHGFSFTALGWHFFFFSPQKY